MRLGIQFYDKRDDAQAMDKFMEVLTRGAISERRLANEYINLITHRMNTGENLPMPPQPEIPEPARPPRPQGAGRPAARDGAGSPNGDTAPEIIMEPQTSQRSIGSSPSHGEAGAMAQVEHPSPSAERTRRRSMENDRALMNKEIKAKTRRLMESSLKKMKTLEGLEVFLGEDGRPSAMGVPSNSLFQSGVAFKKEAAPWLEALAALVYSLAGTQIVILPEGANLSETKMMDMRRTMGISAHLYSAGVAPARVRVNLLNNQVDIPRAVAGFKGLILVFLHDKPLKLVMDNTAEEDAGPALSLGIFPESFKASGANGAIIEFSISDPPSGLASWEFKLLKPASDQTPEEAPIQDVTGTSPVYHQVYWNGRRNYSGALLPGGRYECVLSATDAKNRRRSVQRWIHVLGVSPSRTEDALKQGGQPQGAPPAELSDSQKPSGELLKAAAPAARAVSPRKSGKHNRRKKSRKPVKQKSRAQAQP